ncbi:hypothetical protein D5086_028987 [Populus alba]|uniref:Uncharacterized protein n=1 Tax=Populus alba TaxID=43335 RepID=A0ACC4AS71_POPAL
MGFCQAPFIKDDSIVMYMLREYQCSSGLEGIKYQGNFIGTGIIGLIFINFLQRKKGTADLYVHQEKLCSDHELTAEMNTLKKKFSHGEDWSGFLAGRLVSCHGYPFSACSISEKLKRSIAFLLCLSHKNEPIYSSV